jgi:hypothetical protein
MPMVRVGPQPLPRECTDAEEAPMAATNRPTMRELAAEKSKNQRAEMQVAIDEGRLTVRQMTPKERKASDALREAGAPARAARAAANKAGRGRFSRG